MRTIAVVATLLLSPLGCRWQPGQSLTPPGKIRPPGEANATPKGALLGRKTVASKEAPNLLVAADGSTCTVPERQFRETVAGTDATCLWSKH